MTPDKLNYLLVLAEEQNLTRASKRLFITQPTLTAFINRLENELGVRLFDRSRNPVRLTKSGRIYIEKMKQLVLEEQRLNELLRYQESPQDKIIIGIGQIHSELWCPGLASTLVQRHPLLNIQIRENQEAILMDLLKEGEIDLFFGHAIIDIVNYHFEELCTERLVLLVPRCFLNRSDESLSDNAPDNPYLLSSDELKELPIISPSSAQGLYLSHRQLVEQYHIVPRRSISSANMVTAATMAAMGLGYMYGSDSLLKKVDPVLRSNIVFCTLPKLPDSRKYYCGYSEFNPNLDIIREVIEIMRSHIEVS